MVHPATHLEITVDSQLEVTSQTKDKGKKRVLDGALL